MKTVFIQNIFRESRNMKISKNLKTYLKAHLYSAAGTFFSFQNVHLSCKIWKFLKRLKMLFKSSSIRCRRHIFPKKARGLWKIWKTLTIEKIYLQAHLYPTAGVKLSKINVQKMMENMKTFHRPWKIVFFQEIKKYENLLKLEKRIQKFTYTLPQALFFLSKMFTYHAQYENL